MESLRVFVAVPVASPEARAALAALKGEIAADVRWVPAPQLHFTLKFLASIDGSLVPAMERALAEAAASVPRFRLELRGLGTFPRGGPARVVWIGCGAGREELTRLAAAVEARFVAAGCPPEERPFAAHLTLGRAREPRGSRELASEARRRATFDAGALDVSELVLYRSVLGSAGAEHTPLARAALA